MHLECLLELHLLTITHKDGGLELLQVGPTIAGHPRHRARKLVSSRQHLDTPIAKHHENLLKVGGHAQLRIDVAIWLEA